MAVITKTELKGNAPAKTSAKTDAGDGRPADETVKTTGRPNAAGSTTTVHGGIARGAPALSASEVREKGESAITEGAYERASAKINRSSPMPARPEDNITRVYVDESGAAHDSPPAGGSTQLTGAEADAYRAKHGGSKSAAPTANKAKARTANKSRSSKPK